MQTTLKAAGPRVLDMLSAALGPDGVIATEPRYLSEPRALYSGQAVAILRPDSTGAVARAVRICRDERVGLVPYSGGTGLVGGQTSMGTPPPLVMSFERMNRIREADPENGVLVAEAGVILSDARTAAENSGWQFPLTLASEGSAMIGGLLSTNAGGVNVLRYGNARDLCLGVEAVFADGRVHHGLGRLIKDNMGYDLRHLLIGSEGTLALITAATLRLFPQISETTTAWIAVQSPDAALELLNRMREGLGGSVSAFELIHDQGLKFLAETMPQVSVPATAPTPWIVLTEAEDGPGSAVQDRMVNILGQALSDGVATDGLIAQSEAQRDRLWNVRESIPEANRLISSISSHDVSIPASRISEFIDRGTAVLDTIDTELRINCFGHLGDGNLHFNVFAPRGRARGEFDHLRSVIRSAIHELVHSLNGSVAAEHGVGRAKVDDLVRYGDPAKLAAMRAIKTALDPEGILNPGAMLR